MGTAHGMSYSPSLSPHTSEFALTPHPSCLPLHLIVAAIAPSISSASFFSGTSSAFLKLHFPFPKSVSFPFVVLSSNFSVFLYLPLEWDS